MPPRSRIVHRFIARPGECVVCGARGSFHALDTVSDQPVCVADLDHMLSAEGVLEAMGLGHPSLELVRRNP